MNKLSNINLRSIKGFTLIELILVVTIIGIISAVALTSLNPMTQFQKANDGKVKSDLAQLQRVLEAYYSDNGRYPSHVQEGNNYFLPTIANSTIAADWGDPWTPYMDFLPKSPGYPNRTYVYHSPDGQRYYLYANLERGEQDQQACDSGEVCENVPSGASCGGTCNYGVSSPNVNP